MPCSWKITRVACRPPRKRRSLRASSMSAVLMRSEGVTAVMEATTPAVMPAARLRSGERVPVSGSAKACLIWSKKRKRTPSLPIEPCRLLGFGTRGSGKGHYDSTEKGKSPRVGVRSMANKAADTCKEIRRKVRRYWDWDRDKNQTKREVRENENDTNDEMRTPIGKKKPQQSSSL